jgi:multiple sugar transport system permease protein
VTLTEVLPSSSSPAGDDDGGGPTPPGPARPGAARTGDAGRSLVQTVAGHATLLALGVFCLFPIYWLYATSLRRPQDVYLTSPVPWPLSLGNYTEALNLVDVPRLLVNTALVAVFTALGQLLSSLLAGYAFAAWRFPGCCTWPWWGPG